MCNLVILNINGSASWFFPNCAQLCKLVATVGTNYLWSACNCRTLLTKYLSISNKTCKPMHLTETGKIKTKLRFQVTNAATAISSWLQNRRAAVWLLETFQRRPLHTTTHLMQSPGCRQETFPVLIPTTVSERKVLNALHFQGKFVN